MQVGPLVVKVLGPASVNHPIEYEAIGEMKGEIVRKKKIDQSLISHFFTIISYHHLPKYHIFLILHNNNHLNK